VGPVPFQPRLAMVQAEGDTSGMSDGVKIHCFLTIWLSIADCEILGVRVPLQPRLATVQAEGVQTCMANTLDGVDAHALLVSVSAIARFGVYHTTACLFTSYALFQYVSKLYCTIIVLAQHGVYIIMIQKDSSQLNLNANSIFFE
jgi:hypothetical protein